MINAMPAILREFGDARLTIIGKEVDPSFADAVRQKIQKYKLSNHVRWLGSVNQETLLHEMKQHQIVCLPSREDTLPMAISQAMIVGNIPVTSNAGGMPQMIEDGKNGFLFSAGDSTALSRTLERVFKQSNVELQRMRFRNREFADKTYHPNNVADQTVSVYRSILGK